MKSIEEQLLAIVQSAPYKVALISDDLKISYRQMWDNCLKAAYYLKHMLNLKKGDRVILSAAGNIEFVYAYFGVHIAGGICVPIDPDTNQTRFNYIVDATSPICIMGMLHNVECKTIDFTDVISSEYKYDFDVPQMDDISDILFTTGTTGAPKGVALSYLNVAAAARNINEYIGNSSDDIELLALPVSHSFGLGRLRCALTKGATIVMLGSFANVKKFFGEIKRCGVTMFAMVPSSWGFIKKMSGKYVSHFADQLKYIEIGSSFMAKDEKEFLIEHLPKTRICMHYGSTEASRSAFMEFHEYKNNLLSAGKASPNCEIKIYSHDGVQLPYGQEGEVCVKGEHVTCSYWNASCEYLSDFYDGYFRTGDCAIMDENGNIYLKSRIKEIINVGGKKVAPMEVEDVLNTIPGIKESACIGIPDPGNVLGEVVKAFIVSDENIVTEEAILEYLRPKLEVYKLPVVIERINSIPKTSSGKIQRLSLK